VSDRPGGAPARSDEVVRLLGGILRELQGIREALGVNGAGPAVGSRTSSQSSGTGYAKTQPSPSPAASDRQLDGEKGDWPVKFNPKKWNGESRIGYKLSECEPEFLETIAESFEWFGANPKPGKEQFAGVDKNKASVARGWARRIRDGWAPAAEPDYEGQPGGDVGTGLDDDIPF
jgi:hypothetical protein